MTTIEHTPDSSSSTLWRRLVTAIVAVLLVVAPAVATTAPAAAISAPGAACTPYMAALVPGTWETHESADPSRPVGMLAQVGKKLTESFGTEITVLYPNYPASAFDKGKTYAQSEAAGVEHTKTMLSQCPTSTWVLGGYSQGADVAGDVAWQIGNGRGPIPATQVSGVGLLADPKNGGANKIGPQPKGDHGIAGQRPGGFGALESKTYSICSPTDLYCNVSSKSNPLLASIGSVLGSSPNGEGGTSAATATTAASSSAAPSTGGTQQQSLSNSLVTDYAGADFVGAQSTAQQLNSEVTALKDRPAPSSMGQTGQLASIAGLAQQMVKTFSPVLDTQKFVQTAPGAQRALSQAPADSATGTARTVLSTLNKMDVPGIVNSASSILTALAPAVGAASSTATTPAVATTGTDAAAVPAPAGTHQTSLGGEQVPQNAASPTPPVVAGSQGTATPQLPTDSATTGPLPQTATTAAPWDITATDPSSLTSGASSTGTSSAGINYNALVGPAQQLITQVGPLTGADPSELSAASSALGLLKPDLIINQALNVVTAVAGTDYQGIIANLSKLPQLVFTGNVRGAHDVARKLNSQFEPWVKMAAAMDYKTAGQLVSLIPDPSGTTAIASLVLGFLGNVDVIRLARDVGQIQEVAWKVIETGNLLALSELVPIGLDLASVALGVLSPGAKMDPSQLGAGASPQQMALAQQTAGQDLPGMASSLIGLAGSQGASDLVSLVGEGLDAASFYASNAHGSYPKLNVGGGKNALQWLTDFFTSQLTGMPA